MVRSLSFTTSPPSFFPSYPLCSVPIEGPKTTPSLSFSGIFSGTSLGIGEENGRQCWILSSLLVSPTYRFAGFRFGILRELCRINRAAMRAVHGLELLRIRQQGAMYAFLSHPPLIFDVHSFFSLFPRPFTLIARKIISHSTHTFAREFRVGVFSPPLIFVSTHFASVFEKASSNQRKSIEQPKTGG